MYASKYNLWSLEIFVLHHTSILWQIVWGLSVVRDLPRTVIPPRDFT